MKYLYSRNNESQALRVAKALFVACCMSLSAVVSAVGLGELRHDTYLGQALDGTIELIGTDDLPVENILVRQIHANEAESMGFDLLNAPLSYQLQVIQRSDSTASAISIRSRERVTEPFINILIELQWPGGSVYREYALLFDAPPASTSVKTQVRMQNPVTNAPVNEPELGGTYVVQPGDTLSGIASNSELPAGVSHAQMMAAIHQANPSAFQNNDINLLKAGARLAVPSASDAQNSGAKTNTVADVMPKTPSAAPNDSVIDSKQKSTPAAVKEGRLSLSDSSDESLGRGADYDVPQIRERIDGTQEMIDLLVKENQELRERIENIESSEYLNTLTQLVAMQRQTIQDLSISTDASNALAVSDSDSNSGTATAPMPVVSAKSDDVQQTLSQKLAANFWVFIAFVLIGFFTFVGIVLYAIKSLASRHSPDAGYTSYNSALATLEEEDDLESKLDSSFELPEAEPEVRNEPADNVTKISTVTDSRKHAPLATRLEQSQNDAKRQKDEEVKERIKQKTDKYNTSPVSSQAPARINDVEIDVLVGIDEEVNELLSMAKIYCSAGKFSEARAILTAQQQSENDPRLVDALKQIDEMERSGDS